MQNLTALDGWTGVKGFKNITRQGYDSINSVGKIIPVLKEQIKSSGSLKYYISVSGDYIINNEHRTIKTDSKPKILTNINDVNNSVKNSISEIKTLIEEAQQNGSGYNFQGLGSFYLYYIGYNPTRGASYKPLPFTSNAIINPQNDKDNECLKWCLAIHKARLDGKKEKLSHISKLKKYIDKLDLTGITYPFVISKNNIKKVEK